MDGWQSIDELSQLLSGVRRLERPACEQFVARIQTRVFAKALYIVRDEHTAMDATQDICIKALRQIDELRDVARLHAWLMQMTQHHCVDVLRSRAARREVAIDTHEPSAPAGEDPDTAAVIRRAVYALPDELREAVILYYLEQTPLAEIAQRLDKSANHVGVLLYRARKLLYDKLRNPAAQDDA